MFRLVFPCLLIIILLFVVMKLFHLNRKHQKQYERFVSDFDEVMDNKCLTDTNFQKDNYLFSGVCIKNTCEPERCDQLVCNDQDNECQFMYSVSPKTSVTDDNGNFSCVTKEDIPNHIYCSGVDSIPVCDRLGEEDFCFEYDNHSKTWERESYKKHYISTGECVWMNKTRNTVLEDEEYLVNCRKAPLDCSLCNLPCKELPEIDLTAPGLDITSLFADNYQKYMIRSNADGLSCVPDESHSCFECDESMTKVAYKLISKERRFETKFYGKQNVNGMCLYMNGDECHPDHAEETRAQSRCSFDTGMFSEKVECTQNDYRYCCNLDERDFFKITQYEPALSSDGTKCVYVTVDDSLDRELVSTDPSGFSCPGYDFRLCQDPNEFRNVVEQRCTPCPEGEYLKHRNNFTEATACEELPNCSGETNTEYCFEDMNEAGTIQIQRAYQKEPHVTYSTDDMVLPTASCESTAPSDCRRTCSDPENPDGIELNTANEDGIQKDIYCDQCPTGQKINPNTFECETTIDCPSDESKVECLNRHENTIKEYYKRQDDEFSPCMYVSVDDNYDRIDTSECTNSCDPGYIKGTDNKCVLASCRFNRAYTIIGPENDIPSLYEAEKINMFDTIDNYDVGYHSDNCHIEEIIQSISIEAFDPCDLHPELVECQTSKSPATVCQVDHDTINQLRNEDMLGDVNVSLGDLMVADTSIQKLSSKYGANGDCPVDCLYNSRPIVINDMDVCKDRVNEKVDYYLGDEIVTGTTQKRYNLLQDKKHFGKSCMEAKTDLYTAIGKTPSDVAYDNGNHIIVESTCDLPKRNVPCQTDEDCDACTETYTCVFEQSCMRVIRLQPFGEGSECDPPPGEFVKECANNCANCEEYGKSVWKRTDEIAKGVPITESEWSDLINTPLENGSYSYTRKLIATENCMYQNPDDLTAEREPKAANNVLRIESSNVGKRPLDRGLDNIQAVCDNDASYSNWRPKNGIDCSCDSGSNVREVGTLRTDLTVRGFSITSSGDDCSGNDCPANHCPATFERWKSCSDHYNSRIPCQEYRATEAESERLRYCSNGYNWNWSFPACPTHDCYEGGDIDGEPETDRSPDYECYPSDITTLAQTSNCPPAPFCLADKLEYCSNINNWDWSYTCPTDDCYLGGPVDGVPTLKDHSPHQCFIDDISETDYPSSNCPQRTFCTVRFDNDPNEHDSVFFFKHIESGMYLKMDDDGTAVLALRPEESDTSFWFKYSNKDYMWDEGLYTAGLKIRGGAAEIKNVNSRDGPVRVLKKVGNTWKFVDNAEYTVDDEAEIRVIPSGDGITYTIHNIYDNEPFNTSSGDLAKFTVEIMPATSVCSKSYIYIHNPPVCDTLQSKFNIKDEYYDYLLCGDFANCCYENPGIERTTCHRLLLHGIDYRMVVDQSGAYLTVGGESTFKILYGMKITPKINIIELNSVENPNKFIQYDNAAGGLTLGDSDSEKNQIRITQSQDQSLLKLEVYNISTSSFVLIEQNSNGGYYQFKIFDSRHICRDNSKFDFDCSQQICGETSVEGVLKDEYGDIDCFGELPQREECPDYTGCITDCIPYNGQCAYHHNQSVVYLGVCCSGSCSQVTNTAWACR